MGSSPMTPSLSPSPASAGRLQAAPTVDTRRRVRGAAVLILVAAYGTYIGPGIRTEQVAIYLTAGLVALGWFGRRLDPLLTTLALTLLILAGLSTISAFGTPPDVPSGSLLSGIDALLAPAGLTLVCAAWAEGPGTPALLTTVQQWTVALLVANGLFAVLVLQLGLVEQASSLFWSGSNAPDEVLATGEYAAQQGRYGGVFNTPLAAGTAYAVGLCALIHLGAKGVWASKTRAVLALGLLVGGFLPQSKIFLLVGLPVAALLLLVVGHRRRGRMVLATVGLAGIGWLAFRSTPWWQQYGVPSISRFFTEDLSLDLLTSGRYGDGAAVQRVEALVFDRAPIGGFGAASGVGPLDTGYVELLVRAGLIGVGLGLLWVLVAVAAWIRRRQGADRATWWTAGALLLVLVGAAAGGPSITQNRSGTILVVNLLLALAACRPAAASCPPARRSQSLSLPKSASRPTRSRRSAATTN